MGQARPPNGKWVRIKDKSLVMLILQAYADSDKKKILDALTKPKIILDVINKCKLPQTSSYRKINSLMQNGLLIPVGSVPMKYGKNVVKYISLFSNLEISIVKNDVSLRAKIGDESRSAILRIMREKIIRAKSTTIGKGLSRYTMEGYTKKGSNSIVPYLLKERVIQV